MPEMHKLVNIPFRPAFRERILSGQKTQTARCKKYGKPGDTFEAFGKLFELTEVFWDQARLVAYRDWNREGFESETDFISLWKKLHLRKGWIPGQIIWVHRWREVMSI